MRTARTLAATATATALALALAACTGPDPSPSVSAQPTLSTPSGSASPLPSESPSAQPSVSPSPTATAGAVPADWKAIDPADAGVVVDDVDSVIGAWELPNGTVASIVTYRNDIKSVDPNAVYDYYFSGDDTGNTHKSLTTDAGKPVLAVRYAPQDGSGGEAQAFFFVLTESKITSAVASGDVGEMDESAAELWAVVRTLN